MYDFDKEFYLYVIKEQEKMLMMLMGEKDYAEFSAKIAREGFRKEVEGMADGDFKDFVLENFDTITADEQTDCSWK